MDSEKVLSAMGKLMKDDKKRRIILLIGFLIIALILISTFFDFGSDKKAQPDSTENGTAMTTEEYSAELEKRIAELLNGIEGVGKAKVMLTLEGSSEYVYQSEERVSDSQRGQQADGQKSSNKEETIVMVDGEDGKKQALVKTELTPKIRGIVVVCEGAEQIKVQSQIVNALTTAFDISSAKVSVVKAAS